MRSRALHAGGLLLVLALALPTPLGAQLVVAAEDVPPEYEEPVASWVVEQEVRTSPYHPARFGDAYLADVGAGRIGAVVGDLVRRFDAEAWGAHEPEQGRIVRQLYRLLSAVETALLAPGISGPLDTVEEQDAFLAALEAGGVGLRLLQMEPLVDDAGEEVPGYFGGSADELALFAWEPDGEHVRLLLAPAEVRQWRLLAYALDELLTRQVELVRRENVEDLRAAVARWENYLDEGYSQMPWEALVNGWLIEPPELGPPDRQWIVMHPTVGVELSVEPLDEATVKESLHVEALGHLWYRGRELDDYWGVSASISLREDLEPGIGLLVHLKRHWNLGITWHDVRDDPFLFFSVDLFGFARQNAASYVERYEGALDALGLR